MSNEFQHGFPFSGRFDVCFSMHNSTFPIDYKRPSLSCHAAYQLLLLTLNDSRDPSTATHGNAKSLSHLAIFVGQQWKIQ